jgi:hypothetical protein
MKKRLTLKTVTEHLQQREQIDQLIPPPRQHGRAELLEALTGAPSPSQVDC